MPYKPVLALAAGVVAGVLVGLGVGWVRWGRAAGAVSERLAALEASAAQVQAERERLHRELSDLVRERRDMAQTAEHLRAQVDQQLRRLESLASELAPPPPAAEGEADEPAGP
jgi:hypothetical protein